MTHQFMHQIPGNRTSSHATTKSTSSPKGKSIFTSFGNFGIFGNFKQFLETFESLIGFEKASKAKLIFFFFFVHVHVHLWFFSCAPPH